VLAPLLILRVHPEFCLPVLPWLSHTGSPPFKDARQQLSRPQTRANPTFIVTCQCATAHPDFAARFDDLEPAQVVQRLRRLGDGVGDRVLDALGRGTGDLDWFC
jgi:hypothetical protein